MLFYKGASRAEDRFGQIVFSLCILLLDNMGFISSRDFIILLVFVNSCDCYGEWRECAKKVTRREDLIYRIINEYRARHEVGT